ncbi:GNAT family N-acetyltransferase [Paenibacillus aquistagni]|uniref:GNAT family N-acetyltransferase n=1 Tax=Paenibacillus aquistagni TaxID=1852522 RepID=UPI00145BC323|nr:GNAT family N-acetyltransferase [Paenibacillus aquistagni]NMM52708.1 GNAT family N-acetyltransferase [Paenibacillus aquistagni]
MKHIRLTTEPPANFNLLKELYEALGWNSLQLTVKELEAMCCQSWYAVYAYDHGRLIGMGRVISDGVITGIVCGLGVHPDFQSKGIGAAILGQLIEHCEQHRVIPQLMCTEGLEAYYEKHGFTKFTIGMTRMRT